MASPLDAIDHIVLLMLENRSFDHMLGFLYAGSGNVSPAGQAFDGLTGQEWCPDDAGRRIGVYRIDPADPDRYLMPGADPGEGFQNTTYQLYSTDIPGPGARPDNKGFVLNFKAAIASDLAKGYRDTLAGTQASQIMGIYTPELLPILSGLAKGFAVCDAWFASAPTMTMPNRAFALAATSQGHMDDHVKTFTCPSIFGRLQDKGLDWAIFGYNRDPLTQHDFPDVQGADPSHFGHFRDFQQRCADGTLPAFAFLEPSWQSTGNSQHPNYDVAAGERLIKAAYDAARGGPGWPKTLLIITYDEHGGCYDHLAPPEGASPPGDGTIGEFGFDFTRFGVRVPAVLVSPRIAAGTVFRDKGGVIDHTSVLKTISERFGTEPLTDRDRAAPSLAGVLTLATPRTDDPLAGVAAPLSGVNHPNAAAPSHLDLVQAAKVAALPVRNDHGFYEEASPDLSTAGNVGDFIRDRGAAWSQHVERQRRRAAHAHGSQARGPPTVRGRRRSSRTPRPRRRTD